MTRSLASTRRRSLTRSGLLAGLVLPGALLLGGCSNGFEGASSGAALGALAGLGIGSLSGDAGKGAAAGAIIGGVGGAVLGDQNARNARYNDPYRGSRPPSWYYDDDYRPNRSRHYDRRHYHRDHDRHYDGYREYREYREYRDW